MTDLRQAAQQALEALEAMTDAFLDTEGSHGSVESDAMDKAYAAMTAFRAALAAPQSEPVAWMVTSEMRDGTKNTYPLTGRYKDIQDACDFGDPVPLYTTSPQRQPLSDLYNELLFAVGNKYPNETRHQTALRYLKQAEATSAASTKAHNIGGAT